MATVLSKQDTEKLLQQKPPLVEGLIAPDEQIQPNGVDLTLRHIALFQSPGKITTSNSQRVVSNLSPLIFDGLGFIHLAPGIYSVTYNEIVHLPKNIMALADEHYDLEVRQIGRNELLASAEVFITSTNKGVVPVVKVDQTPIGTGLPGDRTRQLMTAFDDRTKRLAAAYGE